MKQELYCTCENIECGDCEIGNCLNCDTCEVGVQLALIEESVWDEYNAEEDVDDFDQEC